MTIHPLDAAIVVVYLIATVWIGIWFRKLATRKLDAYFLGERRIRWWMIGLSGCSSYVDIGGTMLIVESAISAGTGPPGDFSPVDPRRASMS